MSASGRNRKFKSLENEQNNVRYTHKSGHYAKMGENVRLVPIAAVTFFTAIQANSEGRKLNETAVVIPSSLSWFVS